jgi:arylsulfatase A-like enzyme
MQFDGAITPMPSGAGALASVLTGRYPGEHGILDKTSVHDGEELFLQEHLAENGYQTAAFQAATLLFGTGIENGFETWEEPKQGIWDAVQVVDVASKWWSEADDRPKFAWLSFRDLMRFKYSRKARKSLKDQGEGSDEAFWIAQRQFVAVQGREPSEMLAAYDASYQSVDQALAPFFERLRQSGELERTVVIVTAPFGRPLGQHGAASNRHLWNEVIAVPLFVRMPGGEAKRIDERVSLVDVLSIVWSGAELPDFGELKDQSSGRELGSTGRLGVLTEPAAGSEEAGAALTSEKWKYIRVDGKADRLYDLSRDPFELNNVAADNSHLVVRYRDALRDGKWR